MSYTKTSWVTGDIVTADKMNHIEDGIYNNDGNISTLQTAVNGMLPANPSGDGLYKLINTVSSGTATKSWSDSDPNLAEPYDSTKTYAVGEHCTYKGQYKVCIVPITTAEAWNSAHWADAEVGEEISDLKSALTSEIDGIKNTIYTFYPPDAIIWEQGRYDAASGETGYLTTRIRTKNDFGVWSGVNAVTAKDDYMFLAHAWDASGTYLGVWNGSSFTSSSYWITSVNCAAYPNYKYKLTVKKGSAGSTNISPSDANDMVSFTTYYRTSDNFSAIYDSKNIGFAWESGSIDLDTGLNNAVSGRLRTQYVPVAGGKTYAFNVAESENTYAEYVFYYTADKTPILIDTDNNRYYTRLTNGFFPKTLEIPTGKNIAYIRMMVTTTAFDYYHGQTEENTFSTSYRSHEQRETGDTDYPNNISGYLGKRILLFGDSITAQNNWSKWFETSVKPETLYNYAVGGATWCDPTSGIIYDGTSGTYNVLGNQVQRAVNNDIKNIDCIIILAGTNDTNVTFPNDEDIEGAFFDSSMNAIALADVDRTTWQGAMRWSLETLLLRYPQAKIFVCSPVQRTYNSSEPTLSLYSTIKGKGETIEKMAKRMGVEFVDTMQCGISSQRSKDFADGLHPWQRTSEKIARYIMARYMAHFCQN